MGKKNKNFDNYEEYEDDFQYADQESYDEAYDEDLDYEDEELGREGRFRVAAGVGNFAGVIIGMVVILVLVAVLLTLINWLASDFEQTFSLIQEAL